MLALPFRAIALFFTRPRLFVLGVFPCLISFALAIGASYGVWAWGLQGVSSWIALPVMMLAFLLSWISIGKLSLLLVEDLIIDEVQKAVHGSVLYPAPPFTLGRMARESFYSFAVAGFGLLVLGLSFLPILAPLQFALVAWLAAYSFVGTFLLRLDNSLSGRMRLFFQYAPSNFLLGALLNLLLFVPILNVFLLGFAQILATLVELHRRSVEAVTPSTRS